MVSTDAPRIAQRACAGVLRHIIAGQLPALAHDAPPASFAALAHLLASHPSPGQPAGHIRALAHLIATACHGQRHLWQDLGLAGRAEVSHLLTHYFQPLQQRNVHDLRWKRFLFGELGLQPPGCGQCDQSSTCFANPPATQDASSTWILRKPA